MDRTDNPPLQVKGVQVLCLDKGSESGLVKKGFQTPAV